MKPANPRTLVPKTTWRDKLIAIGGGLGALAFVLVGVFMLLKERERPRSNLLTGAIVAKHASGAQEQEITFGRKGLKSRETESGYSFDIRVDPPGKVYNVPVTKELYNSRNVGEQQSFIRPPSEQR